MRGIYILGNDNVIDDTLALLNSLQLNAAEYPIFLIPYNNDYKKLVGLTQKKFDLQIFHHKQIFDDLESHALAIYGKPAPAFRKFACWFGPCDEFIFFDTDIVVFQHQEDVFELLTTHDIVFCGSGRSIGIKGVFSEKVIEKNIFTEEDLNIIFNTGFFASKKGVLNYDQLMSLFDEAALVPDIFLPHFQDQPMLNYVTLKAIKKRANLRDLTPEVASDVWAGLPNLEVKNSRIYFDTGAPARHIHWAGQKPIARRSYIDLWLNYRYPNKAETILKLLTKTKFLYWRYKQKIGKRLSKFTQ